MATLVVDLISAGHDGERRHNYALPTLEHLRPEPAAGGVTSRWAEPQHDEGWRISEGLLEVAYTVVASSDQAHQGDQHRVDYFPLTNVARFYVAD